MTPEHWQRLVELLAQARALDLDAARELLWRELGELPDLHAQAVKLLAASHERDPGFLDGPENVTASNAADSSGELLQGRFELVRMIGRGGMGAVYLASDCDFEGRNVAVKILLRLPLDSRGKGVARERFRREAQAAQRLIHKGIVKVFSHHLDHDPEFYVMEFVDGPDLAVAQTEDRWREQLALDDPRACARIAAEIADALGVAHEAGLIHRDVKPHNILFDPAAECVRLADFGIAKDLNEDSLSRSQDFLGAPNYVSPEQVDPDCRREIDSRTDVYSLGAVLYELLTRQPPFRGETTLEVLRRVAEDSLVPVRRLAPGVPLALAAVCERALRRARDDRYLTAQEFAADLRAAADGRPVTARRQATATRLMQWMRRRPSRGVAVFGVAVATVVLTVLIWMLWANWARSVGDLLLVAVGASDDVQVQWQLLGARPESLAPPHRTATDAKGRALLASTEPGRYRVRVVAAGAGIAETVVDCVAGEAASYTVQVHPRDVVRQGMRRVAAATLDCPVRVAAKNGPDRTEPCVANYAAFWIDEAPVTNADYLMFLLHAKPDKAAEWEVRHAGDRPDWRDLPATGMSFSDARAYTAFLGKRLPSLTEWRAAALGNDQGQWLVDLVAAAAATGQELPFVLGGQPYLSNSNGHMSTLVAYHKYALPVLEGGARGSHQLFGLVGNTMEWVDDFRLFEIDGELRSDLTKPLVVGTSWQDPKNHVSVAALTSFAHMMDTGGSLDIGFRCAISDF